MLIFFVIVVAVQKGGEENRRRAEAQERLLREAKREIESLTGAARIEHQFSLLTQFYESASEWWTVDQLSAASSMNPHVVQELLPRLVEIAYLKKGSHGEGYKITAQGGRAVINWHEKGRAQVGDFIYAAEGSTVNNRSLIQGSFNKVEGKLGEEVEKALRKIGEAVSASGDAEAAEMYAAFLEELGAEKPKKSVLRVLFEGVCAAVPAVSSLTSAVAAVVTLMK
ncbi:hypothetical protein [Micromonospora nigra]|nr:hypothetical protein [Micromonospora nigra]